MHGPFSTHAELNKERKVIGRKRKENIRRKFFYADTHSVAKHNNPFPRKWENKILCADSYDILSALPENCVDLIFTSPPYNFGLDYQDDSKDDAVNWAAYFERLFQILDQCERVLVHGGRLVVNVQPLYSDYIPTHHIIGHHLMSRNMIWKGEIIWEKNNYNCKYTAWGSWKSPASPYLKYSWEFLEVFCKGDLKKSGTNKNADIDGEEFKKWVYGKWSIAPERRMQDYKHPAMFPEELANRVLKLFSFKGDLVLDPFNGAGTSCVAAARTGRRYCGVDIAQDYCRMAEKRIAKMQLTL